LPGVIAESIIRVELLPDPRAFDAVIAVVLVSLGAQLVVRRAVRHPTGWGSLIPIVLIAALVGCVGDIYGIGAGTILAPILIGGGRSPKEVSPTALASTFLASVGGVTTFWILATTSHASVTPDWGISAALGAGGLLGGYCGARLQPRPPEETIRRILGAIVTAIGASGKVSQLGRQSHRIRATPNFTTCMGAALGAHVS
jgi:hypothetical protein